MAHHLQGKVREALVSLLMADGLSEVEAKAKAERNLGAASLRAAEKVRGSGGPAAVAEWRAACMDLRTWIRLQP